MSTVLEETRELLSDPERWTKDGFARDGDDQPTHWADPNAVCWCLGGAISRVSAEHKVESREAFQAIYMALEKFNAKNRRGIKVISLSEFNDLHTITHSDVLALLTSAIIIQRSKNELHTRTD